MAIIPDYGTYNYGAKPIDFSPIIETLRQNKQKRDQNERLQLQATQKLIDNIDPSKLWSDKHTSAANEEIKTLQNDWAKALTENHKKGLFGSGEPKLSNEQTIEFRNRAVELGKKYQQWTTADKTVSKMVDEYIKNPKDVYDQKQFDIDLKTYNETGDITGLTFLSPASKNPVAVFSDKKLDPRSDELKKPTVTLSPDNTKEITTYPSLDPKQRDLIYNSLVDSSVPVQKGLVDQFMYDNTTTPDQKKEYMLGNLISHEYLTNPNISDMDKVDQISNARKQIDDSFKDYDVHRKFDPYLIETAKNYGSHVLKLNELIGQGSVQEKPNISYINQQKEHAQSLADKKKEETEKSVPLTPENKTIMGKKYPDYLDFGNIKDENKVLENFTLPKGSTKRVESYDQNTGEALNINFKGKNKAKRVEITNPNETNWPENYTVVGVSKSKGKILLAKKDVADRKYELPSDNPDNPKPLKVADREVIEIPYDEKILKNIYKKQYGKNEPDLEKNDTKFTLKGYGDFTREELKKSGWTDKQIDALK